MTRGRDVFWGIYAAATPFLVIHCFGSLEKMLGEYASRTYDSLTAFFGQAFLALLLGVVLASLVIGGFIGAVAAYFGGWLDNVLMRIMDVFLAIPSTLLAIAIVASLGSSITNLIIAMSISGIPGFSRIVRSSVLTVKDNEYIEAARAIGATDRTILFGHVLPNGMAPLIVQATLRVANVILSTAGLSFLGLGVPAPHPEWGALLTNARSYIRDYSYMCLFPGLAIMTTILSLNLFGDGLRDALDPKQK